MRALCVGLCMLAGAALAAPETSQRPVARTVDPAASPAPPDGQGAVTLRPILRPDGIAARARARIAGQVCGDPALQGDTVGAVPGRIAGCGITKAVRLRSVSGVALSQPALIDCTTAKALKRWTDTAAKPALRGVGGGVARFRVAAHYTCRTRNNQPGARVSEHGRGRAIDISGFELRDGSTVTVLEGWTGANRRALRTMHRAACGPFGTVLGPGADRFHRDHFHFDTARDRTRSYCR